MTNGNVICSECVRLEKEEKERIRKAEIEERKKQNRQPWAGKYCPFDEGEKVSKTYYGLKLTGRIAMIDRDYYEGDCPVLYVDLDKRSSKKWIGRKKTARPGESQAGRKA